MTRGRVLFLGGTGTISTESVRAAQARGFEVTVLNRGHSTSREVPPGVEVLRGDVRDAASVARAVDGRDFDSVVDFMAFTPDHVAQAVELFEGRTGQYVFISSASVYRKPVPRLPITESSPVGNPFSQYARDKIACEQLLLSAYRDRGFPVTIVRPSHTYDRQTVPLFGGWTAIERMRRGEPTILHGDGTSLWVMTHSRDFAVAFTGLIGNPRSHGEVFQITSDEMLTWNQIAEQLATAAGVEPNVVHVTSAALVAEAPEEAASHLGDRTHSVIFDNAKVKSLVPEYTATTPFWAGAREIVEWHDADPARRAADERIEQLFDRLVAGASR
ncbi:NAD-dependent epimerase/dehydratase family protein [Compostimonas suwonensis]|uniref:Nucleoside-diphosphate-sugar epimerase n=1 Tax=Compostimonas suwonensis TaxID=1048394 RepID=A0A2M9C408_9MICO|nr:NAD-dependent epimerase/dehydratase family protein [Compostimonas suwonensis]PJJ65265.1 nucleoside-diphosphate-sugar epimerase [Compostimonas suwonensis]